MIGINILIEKTKFLLSNKILRASAGILFITMLVKILGYVEKLVLANYYGTSYHVDVYTLVLTIVLSIFFFFREIIEPGYLSVFLACKTKDEKESWSLFNGLLRLVFLLTLGLSSLAIIYPEVFSKIFAPGFEGDKLNLSNTLIRITIPAGIFLALSTLTSITLNGLKIFVLPASGELAFKTGIVCCMVFFYKEFGIIGAAIGIVVGSIAKLAVHLVKVYKKISFKKIKIEPKTKKLVWKLTWPLLIGVGFSQLSSLVDNIFASFLHEGAIAALSYAKKVVELPVVLFPYVISIVIFPYFTQLAVEKQQEKLKKMLADSLKWILIAFLPISVFFIVYSNTIVEIIFQRGAFDVNSTLLTVKPFVVYSFGLVFFAIETILVIFYYSNADTKTPVFVGIGCVILNIVLTWFFVNSIGYSGIALAYVIQKTLKNIILLYLLKRKIFIDRMQVLRFTLKLIIPFFSTIIIFVFLKKVFVFSSAQNLLVKAGFLACSFLIGVLFYSTMLWYSKILKTKVN